MTNELAVREAAQTALRSVELANKRGTTESHQQASEDCYEVAILSHEAGKADNALVWFATADTHYDLAIELA
jgi:hypothetical protein